MQGFDKKEFGALKMKYGKNAVVKRVHYNFESAKFFSEFKYNVENNRRGEVAFFVERKNGRFILVRTKYYPEGVCRVPTGGIDFDESVEDALLREVREELGLTVTIEKFLGVINHKVDFEGERLEFYSYGFWLKEQGGTVLEDATENEISEIIETDKQGIAKAASGLLMSTNGKWTDWCRYRGQTTGFILSYI